MVLSAVFRCDFPFFLFISRQKKPKNSSFTAISYIGVWRQKTSFVHDKQGSEETECLDKSEFSV